MILLLNPSSTINRSKNMIYTIKRLYILGFDKTINNDSTLVSFLSMDFLQKL